MSFIVISQTISWTAIHWKERIFFCLREITSIDLIIQHNCLLCWSDNIGLPVQRKKKPWICLPPGSACICLYKYEFHIEHVINFIEFVEGNVHFKGRKTTEIGSMNKSTCFCVCLKSQIDIELHSFDDLTRIILFHQNQNQTHSIHSQTWPLHK